MIKGLYSAVSAMVVGMQRQTMLSHNIANLETPGFRELMSTLTDFEETNVVFSPGNITHSSMLNEVGTLGLGTMKSEEYSDFEQGGLKNTGNVTDFGIDGPGFFRIETPDGERYTRDGRFIVTPEGNLVTVEGYGVLDSDGQAITLPTDMTGFSVDRDGSIYRNEIVDDGDPAVQTLEDGSLVIGENSKGELLAQIGLAKFENPRTDLTRSGNNYFEATGDPITEEAGFIHQGYLEMSNVNVSRLMTQMVMISRSYEAAQKMVVTQDEMISKTIASLGAV